MKEKFDIRKLDGVVRLKLERDDHSCGKYWEADKSTLVYNIIDIVSDYSSQGYNLTLRQLYYQLVSRNIMPNDNVCYKKLSSLLDDCRYGGKVDWDDIEDRGRVPYTPYYEHSVSDALTRTLNSYRLDRRTDQETHIEVWTEKDAISSILKRTVQPYTLTVSINKGFISSTAIHEAYERFMKYALKKKKKVVILYFGDHDPSGLEMVEDIKRRIYYMASRGRYQRDLLDLIDDVDLHELFSDFDLWQEFSDTKENKEAQKRVFAKAIAMSLIEVRHVGLTLEQVQQYNLPPNPAKLTDPRAKAYIEKFGQVSWEVDALNPKIIEDIIKTEVLKIISTITYNKILDTETQHREILNKMIASSAALTAFSSDEVGVWECPVCMTENSDPENIRMTICGECDTEVVLSDVIDGKRKAKEHDTE